MAGNEENNTLLGFHGDDVLAGGLGNDYLRGDEGNDTFLFDSEVSRGGNRDTIADFAAGEDRIELKGSLFSTLVADGVLSEENFCANETGTSLDNNDYILYNT